MLDQADYIGSTTGIIKRAVETPNLTSIVATEDGAEERTLDYLQSRQQHRSG